MFRYFKRSNKFPATYLIRRALWISKPQFGASCFLVCFQKILFVYSLLFELDEFEGAFILYLSKKRKFVRSVDLKSLSVFLSDVMAGNVRFAPLQKNDL